MKSMTTMPSSTRLNERLATNGLRSTAQREQVYRLLLAGEDHPTAEEVFMRAKRELPEISMATVYNCLDALVKCGLLRQVNLDRSASRYCPNMAAHSHFFCEHCGRFFDIAIDPKQLTPSLPEGFHAWHSEVSIRGSCPDCPPESARNNHSSS